MNVPHYFQRVLRRLIATLKRIYAPISQSVAALPAGFEGNTYLQLNPDVKNAGIDPAEHYLRHGRPEGRLFLLPAIDVCDITHFNTEYETILVVSHEASRTGAPVLSLNLVQELAANYNVVALLLGGGPLTKAFQSAGAAVITSPHLRGNSVIADMVVNQLCERFKLKFALVNSIESRVVLPTLASNFVPAISLIHEFAAYTRPRDAFGCALLWSGEAVFSAKVTRDNAFAEYPHLAQRATHVLPQGRCLLPPDDAMEDERLPERTRIRSLIRPKGIADNSLIVLGAGYIQYRKGVDLFIECATRVLQSEDGKRCRFVWIGKGFDPTNDVAYSVYLADQIRRAGLQKHIAFIDETSAIEVAYEEADMLLLSSRLDPLPNVAIDAMAYGAPVLCFDKTTGIADFLIAAGLADNCVAEYINSADMAEKILSLARLPGLLQEVAERCRKASVEYFNLKNYVSQLVTLAQGACERTLQEQTDTKTILESELYRRDFSCPLHLQGKSIEIEVRTYVRAWASGIDRRKPFPGFNPGIYLEQHGIKTQNSDPFADYLREGRPQGPWNYPVIVPDKKAQRALPSNQNVALHLHVYYPDLLSEIIERLGHNKICPDLFISINHENVREQVCSALNEYKGKVAYIQVVPNCGRDIGPFLTAFGPTLLANYEYIGHIHTKKSVDTKDGAMGQVWSRFLLENLLGSDSRAMADSILGKLKKDPSIGLVFPDDPFIVGLEANRSFAEALTARLELPNLADYFAFPVGTMFWARAAALAPLINLNFGWEDYPEEPLATDGTLLHAIERLFALSLPLSNLRFATTNVVGVTR